MAGSPEARGPSRGGLFRAGSGSFPGGSISGGLGIPQGRVENKKPRHSGGALYSLLRYREDRENEEEEEEENHDAASARARLP